MSRFRPNLDSNHHEIVDAYRAVGASVEPRLAQLHEGCPDILVGFRGVNYVVEIKDGNKPRCRQALTTEEKDWHDGWRGRVDVVSNKAEALAVIGL